MANTKAPSAKPEEQNMSDQPARPDAAEVTQGPVTMPTPDAPEGPRESPVTPSGESDDAADPKPAEAGAKAKAHEEGKKGKIRVTCPNTEFSGVSAGVRFIDGEGFVESDNEYTKGWFKENGYTVEGK